MALLFMDSFSGDDGSYKWDNGSSGYTTNTASPRVAGCYWADFPSVNSIYKSFPQANKIIVGFGVKTDRSWGIIFQGDGGGTDHISVTRGASALSIRRGNTSGTVLTTGTTPLYDTQWNYVEASVTVSDTVGEVHVRLNGQSVDELSFTGDTKNGGTLSTLSRIQFYTGSGAAQNCYLADFYICDDTGATNNNFLGDVVVRTLTPNANGTYSQLTGSDADQVNNYLLVDEHPYSSADYVGSTNPGDKDTYAFSDLPATTTTVYGIQVTGLMAKSDGGLGSARYVLRSGGNNYVGPTRPLNTTFSNYYEVYQTDPATSTAWTTSGVNNIEAGMEVV